MTEVVQPEWMQGFEPTPVPPGGRWQKGMPSPNPAGRPKGPDKRTKLMQRMLDEAGEVVDAVLAKAKEGDSASAGLVLSRILPVLRSQSQTVQFDFDPSLPIARQIEQVLAGIAAGAVPPDIGQQIINAIGTLSNARAVEELESRIILLEAKQVT